MTETLKIEQPRDGLLLITLNRPERMNAFSTRMGEDVLAHIPGLASSTGSACHEGNTEPSPVLTAMGLDRARALAALRLTLGRWTDETQVAEAAKLLVHEVQ